MKEAFINKSFRAASIQTIAQAIKIINEYRGQGFILTLRQLYYQFVARGLLANTVQNYKKLGNTISDARLAGYIDWDTIEDRTRELKTITHWQSPAEIIRAAYESYKLSKWDDQPNYCEVWIEKEALAGVIERICHEYDIPFFACRGYVSQSEQYSAGKRLHKIAEDKPVKVFHMGDHDPSGIDMTRDNQARLDMFAEFTITVERLALNMNQVEEHNPPPNPAKTTDSRYQEYTNRYGEDSWELDALNPQILETLITEAVEPLIDYEEWHKTNDRQETEKNLLRKTSENWNKVVNFLKPAS